MKRTYSLSPSHSHSHRHAVILLYTSHSWVNCKFPSSFCINYLCTSFYGCAKCRDSPSPPTPRSTRLRVATDRNSSCSGTKEVKGGGGGAHDIRRILHAHLKYVSAFLRQTETAATFITYWRLTAQGPKGETPFPPTYLHLSSATSLCKAAACIGAQQFSSAKSLNCSTNFARMKPT